MFKAASFLTHSRYFQHMLWVKLARNLPLAPYDKALLILLKESQAKKRKRLVQIETMSLKRIVQVNLLSTLLNTFNIMRLVWKFPGCSSKPERAMAPKRCRPITARLLCIQVSPIPCQFRQDCKLNVEATRVAWTNEKWATNVTTLIKYDQPIVYKTVSGKYQENSVEQKGEGAAKSIKKASY